MGEVLLSKRGGGKPNFLTGTAAATESDTITIPLAKEPTFFNLTVSGHAGLNAAAVTSILYIKGVTAYCTMGAYGGSSRGMVIGIDTPPTVTWNGSALVITTNKNTWMTNQGWSGGPWFTKGYDYTIGGAALVYNYIWY